MTPLGPRAVFNVFACTDDVELLSRMMRMQQKYRDFCVRGFSSNAVLDGAFLKQQDILVIYLQFSLVEDRWYSWFETFATLQSRLAVRLIVSFSQIRSEYMHLLKYRIDSFLQVTIHSQPKPVKWKTKEIIFCLKANQRLSGRCDLSGC